MWKPSAKSFILNDIENIYRMEKKLKEETWKNGKPKEIKITYPKKRDGLSISFKDRVYQRSINDNALYPAMARTFILDNCACQTGKGPDFARKRLKKHLWNFYRNYGLDGYVLQTDIHGYYPNMRHDAVKACFKKRLDPEVFQMVCEVLDAQYEGEIGYNPGSQMVQIAGISVLDGLDHYIKEQLHVRHYIRYMDDSIHLYHNRCEAERNMEIIEQKLNEIGFKLNHKKTRIIPLAEGFMFLGFRYRMTESGKILMTLDPQNVKHERRKLRKMVAKAKRGEMTKEKVDECYRSWKNHAEKGNSYKLIQRMDQYYRELWRDENANFEQAETAAETGKRTGKYKSSHGRTEGADGNTETPHKVRGGNERHIYPGGGRRCTGHY